MVNRTIKVKVIKENKNSVTIKLVTVDRSLPVPRDEFEKRVKEGLYTVVE